MITSKDNEKLRLIRKLAERKHREREELFVAEGEDLVAAAEAAGWGPEFVLRSGVEVEPSLLDAVSALGSGTRMIGVYRRRWSESCGFHPPSTSATHQSRNGSVENSEDQKRDERSSPAG